MTVCLGHMQNAARAPQQPTEAPAVQVVQDCTTYLLELVTACEVCRCESVMTCRCPKASGELIANSLLPWQNPMRYAMSESLLTTEQL